MTWAESIQTWLRLVPKAYREGDANTISEFEMEVKRMARAADMYHEQIGKFIPVDAPPPAKRG